MTKSVNDQSESSDPLAAAWAVETKPIETDEDRLEQLLNYLSDHVEGNSSLSVGTPWGKTPEEVAELRREANTRGARMPDTIVHSSMLVLGSGANHTLPYIAYAKGKVRNRDEVIDDVPVRIFTPTNPTGAVVIAAHGGSFWMGNGELRDNSFSPTCGALAERSGAVVVDVDYRLAPEHPMPAAAKDIATVVNAISSGALDLSSDLGGSFVEPLIVFGNSSGGNAAVNSLSFIRDDIDVALLLDKPAVDLRGAPGGMLREIFGTEDSSDPMVSPVLADVPGGLRVHVQSALKEDVVLPPDAFVEKVEQAGGTVSRSFFMSTHLVATPTVQREQITDSARFILEVTGTHRDLADDDEGIYDKEAVDRDNEKSWKK